MVLVFLHVIWGKEHKRLKPHDTSQVMDFPGKWSPKFRRIPGGWCYQPVPVSGLMTSPVPVWKAHSLCCCGITGWRSLGKVTLHLPRHFSLTSGTGVDLQCSFRCCTIKNRLCGLFMLIIWKGSRCSQWKTSEWIHANVTSEKGRIQYCTTAQCLSTLQRKWFKGVQKRRKCVVFLAPGRFSRKCTFMKAEALQQLFEKRDLKKCMLQEKYNALFQLYTVFLKT